MKFSPNTLGFISIVLAGTMMNAEAITITTDTF
jgi:hypothetical protein